MDDKELKAFEAEVNNYKNRKKYAECVERMDERAKKATDPEMRALALMAKSTCAAELNDLALADSAAFADDIKMEALSPGMRHYVNLVRGQTSRH